jgi:hypothetical protein
MKTNSPFSDIDAAVDSTRCGLCRGGSIGETRQTE